MGLREYALAAGATVSVMDVEGAAALKGETVQVQNCPTKSPDAIGAVVGFDRGLSGAMRERYGTHSRPSASVCCTLQRQQHNDIPSTPYNAGSFHLLAFPSECNFSGQCFDVGRVLEASTGIWGKGGYDIRGLTIQNGSVEASGHTGLGTPELSSRPHDPPPGNKGRRLILLDAAKACATAPPDLSKHPVDFVVLSYYKIFG